MSWTNALEKIKIIAIVGTDRSGSTLLDKIISSNDEIFSVGEANHFFHYYTKNLPCACGKPILDCDFWRKILGRLIGTPFKPEMMSVLRWRKRVMTLTEMIIMGRHHFIQKYKRYLQTYALLMRAVQAETGAGLIVDSSKDMTRVYLLYLSGLFQVYPIYITREVEDYAVSAKTKYQMQLDPDRKTGEKKALLRWIFRNAETSLLLRRGFPDYVQIGYKKLATDPSNVMKLISKKWDIPLVYERDRVRQARYHFLGGNFMKFNEFEGIRLDVKDTSKVFRSIPLRVAAKALNEYFIKEKF